MGCRHRACCSVWQSVAYCFASSGLGFSATKSLSLLGPLCCNFLQASLGLDLTAFKFSFLVLPQNTSYTDVRVVRQVLAAL